MFYQVADPVLNWVASTVDKAREPKYHYRREYAQRENQYRATADCRGVKMHHYDAMKLLIEAPTPKERNLMVECKTSKKGPGHITTDFVLL